MYGGDELENEDADLGFSCPPNRNPLIPISVLFSAVGSRTPTIYPFFSLPSPPLSFRLRNKPQKQTLVVVIVVVVVVRIIPPPFLHFFL
ncbi:hypothetical protein SDJN03_28694, partial [Cucurbita argyrosperma subsp. sororia]